jgi:hypothetical protein
MVVNVFLDERVRVRVHVCTLGILSAPLWTGSLLFCPLLCCFTV